METRAAILQKLTELHEEIRGRLERIVADANKPLDADFEEQAVERENAEVLVALDRFVRAEMAQIEKTLARLNLRSIRRSDHSEETGGGAVCRSLRGL